MKAVLRFAVFMAAGLATAGAQDIFDELRQRFGAGETPRIAALDPKRIINESNSFLKEREPEMTAEEYAIYEKVVTMLTTNVDLAVKMLEGMMDEKERPSPAFEFILGNAYYAANQVERAEKNYRSAVTRFPSFVRAWNNLGVLYYTSGRFAEAEKCLAKSVSLGDRESTTLGLLGFSLEKQGNLVSAEVAYMQALSSDPRNGDWKEGLLRICIEEKQFGRAESLVKALIREQPGETRFWHTYAHVLLAQQRRLEAAALLEAAAGAGVAGADELLLLGDLYAEQGLAAEAVAIYQRLPAASGRGENKLLQLARTLLAAGKWDDADRAIGALPAELSAAGRQAVHQLRAEQHIAHRRWDEARKEIEALLALAPLDGRALLTLGRIHLEQQDVPRATLAFEAAARSPGSAYRASLELANIEIRNRHYAKAVEHLEKALSIEKTDTVQDYLVRLKALAAQETGGG